MDGGQKNNSSDEIRASERGSERPDRFLPFAPRTGKWQEEVEEVKLIPKRLQGGPSGRLNGRAKESGFSVVVVVVVVVAIAVTPKRIFSPVFLLIRQVHPQAEASLLVCEKQQRIGNLPGSYGKIISSRAKRPGKH
uniref:Uncharacterized protein n=1 Tax=Anopheles farauti TaxID=69004 RepID=A0A182QJW8_9DIPT